MHSDSGASGACLTVATVCQQLQGSVVLWAGMASTHPRGMLAHTVHAGFE